MKLKKHSSLIQSLFLSQIASLWPALKGSLALVHKPCIRPGCPTCARGDKHPAHLLAFTHKGRRRCMYVPLALLPLMKRALRNGRKIEQLLYENGPALIRQHREDLAQRPRQRTSKKTIKQKS
jgi:hypothetical protein